MACDVKGVVVRQSVNSSSYLVGDLVVSVAEASINLDAVLALVEAGIQVSLHVFPTVCLGSAKRENGNPVNITFCKERLRIARVECVDQLEAGSAQSAFQNLQRWWSGVVITKLLVDVLPDCFPPDSRICWPIQIRRSFDEPAWQSWTSCPIAS